jgi:hypothetical protein
MKRLSLFVFLAAVWRLAVLSAADLTFSFNQHATGNVFQTRDKISDHISTLSLSLTKDFSGLSLFSEAGYSHFAGNPGLSFGGATAGLDYLRPMGEKSALYFSGTADAVLFSSDFSDFDHAVLSFLGAFKSYLGPNSILKAGAALEYRNYRDSLFDFISQTFSISLDRFFKTKTTAKAGLNWGYKYFLHPFLAPAPESPADGSSQGGNGKGRHHGGTGYGLPSRSDSQGAGIQTLSLSALAAQGIGTRLGLSLSAVRQWNLSGGNPFQSVEEFYLAENPTYDDFSWAGWGLTGLITLRIPWEIDLKMGYTVSDKTFPGIESLTPDGIPTGVIRHDRRNQIETRLEKAFSKFSVFLSYSFIDNRSNDPYFDWRSGFLTGGIEWRLPFGKSE